MSGDAVSEVKGRADIVEIISRYVRLKKAGANYTGLCPFHSEKTPSFSVNTSKQIFHCFGCGESGDVYSFLMKIDNISFYESLKNLASEVGVVLPQQNKQNAQNTEKFDHAFAVMEKANQYFQQNLKQNMATMESYLKKRGLDESTVSDFKIGYASDSWDGLVKGLREFKTEELFKGGLVKKSEKSGRSYDTFRNRLIFPIENLNGKVVGFGGRALIDDKKSPKYLNSPETDLYKKSRILYGLNKAVKAGRNDKFLILVEGYMDLISLHQFGLTNSAAVLGTSLTDEHVLVIKRQWKEAVLLFDGDAAGIRAAERSFLLLSNRGVSVRGVILAEGEDPDSFIRKDQEGFKTLVTNAVPFVKELVSYWKERAGKGAKEIAQDSFPLIRSLTSSIERADAMKYLSETTGYREETLLDEFSRVPREHVNVKKDEQKTRKKPEIADKAIKNLLGVLLRSPELRDKAKRELTDEGFLENETYWKVFQRILDKEHPLEGINELPDEEKKILVETDFLMEEYSTDEFNGLYEDAIKLLKNKKNPHVPRFGVAKADGTMSDRYRVLQEQLKSL